METRAAPADSEPAPHFHAWTIQVAPDPAAAASRFEESHAALAHPVAERDAFFARHLVVAVGARRLGAVERAYEDHAAPARAGSGASPALPAAGARDQDIHPHARFGTETQGLDRRGVGPVGGVVAVLRGQRARRALLSTEAGVACQAAGRAGLRAERAGAERGSRTTTSATLWAAMQPPGVANGAGGRSGGDQREPRGLLIVRTRRAPRNPQEADSVRIIVGRLRAKLRGGTERHSAPASFAGARCCSDRAGRFTCCGTSGRSRPRGASSAGRARRWPCSRRSSAR